MKIALIFSLLCLITFLVYKLLIKTRQNITSESEPKLTKVMSPELIIQNYGKALSIKTGGVARPISLLSNSKEEIVEAFRVLVPKFKDDSKTGGAMMMSYSAIDDFINDDKAIVINKVSHELKLNKEVNLSEKEIHAKFLKDMMLNRSVRLKEFSSFLKS